MKTLVLAIGKMRGADAELCAEYKKRLGGGVAVREIAAARNLSANDAQKSEAGALCDAIPAGSFIVLLDERGNNLSSRELAAKLGGWRSRASNLVFVIGGADGVTEELRARASFTLAFGRQTWPHRLARVMLLEQLYRAQQINAGHPYHRD